MKKHSLIGKELENLKISLLGVRIDKFPEYQDEITNAAEKKKYSLTKKVDNWIAISLLPFGIGWWTWALTYCMFLTMLEVSMNQEISFWSLTRLELQLQAIGITIIVLPLVALLVHFIARIIDSLYKRKNERLV